MTEVRGVNLRDLRTLSPRTRHLLACVFPDEDQAGRWLDRPNPVLGGAPRQLIDQGRERELQNYLAKWLIPSDPPPVPLEALFPPQDPAAS